MSARVSKEKPAAWYRFNIGDFNATIVSDGELTFESCTSEFPEAPVDQVNKLLENEFLPNAPMVLQENALVLDTGKRVILFDTGFGEVPLFGTESGKLPKNLVKAGIKPEDIDTVILTHIHPDHAWGLTNAEGKKTFPNAEVFVSKTDYDFWTDESKVNDENMGAFVQGARKAILPYKDRLTLIEKNGEVLPGISALSFPGHTLGHTSYLIQSGNEAFLNLGDICHHYALLFPFPRWKYKWDIDADLAVQSRLKCFDMAVADNLTLLGFHFPFPGIGRIRRDGEGFRYVPRHMSLV
jgi:glyoxylase-like metal-dependent hydrolase (beta-lactamase superfamily II)